MSSMPVRSPRGRASMAPVWLLVRNKMPSWPGQLGRLDDGAVGHRHLGAGRDVGAGGDDAVVAERDADAGVGADQAVLADRDDGLAAARQGAHDRRSAADVRAVADRDAGRDAALDHRGAERAGVVVDEALVHHGRALGEVGAEAYAVGVADADTGRDDVVGHARELVDARDLDVQAGATGAGADRLEAVDRAGAERRPHDVGQQPEDAVEVLAVRGDEPVRQQVQAQVDVVRVGRRLPAGRRSRCGRRPCAPRGSRPGRRARSARRARDRRREQRRAGARGTRRRGPCRRGSAWRRHRRTRRDDPQKSCPQTYLGGRQRLGRPSLVHRLPIWSVRSFLMRSNILGARSGSHVDGEVPQRHGAVEPVAAHRGRQREGEPEQRDGADVVADAQRAGGALGDAEVADGVDHGPRRLGLGGDRARAPRAGSARAGCPAWRTSDGCGSTRARSCRRRSGSPSGRRGRSPCP